MWFTLPVWYLVCSFLLVRLHIKNHTHIFWVHCFYFIYQCLFIITTVRQHILYFGVTIPKHQGKHNSEYIIIILFFYNIKHYIVSVLNLCSWWVILFLSHNQNAFVSKLTLIIFVYNFLIASINPYFLSLLFKYRIYYSTNISKHQG